MNKIQTLINLQNSMIDVVDLPSGVVINSSYMEGSSLTVDSALHLLSELKIAYKTIFSSICKLENRLEALDFSNLESPDISSEHGQEFHMNGQDTVNTTSAFDIKSTGKLERIVHEKSTAYRKPRDITKLTQWMYNFILAGHREFLNYNQRVSGGKRATTMDLTFKLNSRLKMNKSRAFYTRIWNKGINFHDLPVGKLIPE